MENVTLEIVAQLRDEASQPMKSLTGLCDRLSDSLDAMRARLKLAGAEMAAFMGSAVQTDAHAYARTGGGRAASAPAEEPVDGTSTGAVLDMSAVNAALSGFSTALSDGTGRLTASVEALGEALSGGADRASGMGDAALRAGESALDMAGGLGRGASAAGVAASASQAAASALRALGSAAGELRGRFAAFRLPAYAAHATGGIMSTPHLGLVAEDGPEAIIPLGADKRGRGIELLRQAGRRLGVRDYAMGGVPAVAAVAAQGGGISMGGVNVNIELHSAAAPQQAIAESGAQIADQVARAIADGLEQALRNMA